MCGALQVAVSLKEILDPNKQEGESISLPELHGEIFEPARDLNRGNRDYLNMVRTADLHIILMIVIVNKMYEKGAKGVKFDLLIRFFSIFGRISSFAGFLLGCFLGSFALGTRSSVRFI